MVGVILPSPEADETLAESMRPWEISSSELAAYLLFFDHVGYFSGYRPPSVMFRLGEPFLLKLPYDPYLDRKPLIVGFFTSDPRETVAQAMAIQIGRGFSSAAGEIWAYHPKYFCTNAALDASVEKAPSVGVSFLDGLWCPAEAVSVEEVLRFKEDRAPEREAFMAALLEASENIDVSDNGLVLGVPIEKIDRALNELNRTAIERWASGVKRSFRWGIRPNQATLLKLSAAVSSYEYLGNATASVLLALWGAVEFSIDLTPRLEPASETSRAMSYVMDIRRSFDNPEAYTRFRLKSPGKLV